MPDTASYLTYWPMITPEGASARSWAHRCEGRLGSAPSLTPLIPGTCECYLMWEVVFAHVIKDFEIWKIMLDYPGGP